VIGPLLRDAVYAAKPKQGDYLMAYFNKGVHQYSDRVEAELRKLAMPVRVYGTGRAGGVDQLEYRPPSIEGFIEDLAGARAVLATAGHQLISEALHFGKPLYLLPEDCFEQRLNAYMVQRMGVGVRGDLASLSADRLEDFFANVDGYGRRAQANKSDGRVQAQAALRRFLVELDGRAGTAWAATKPS
jgi:uncharacterized protein (TIGR00661 family)